jgi:ATP-dependent RNA helicase DDX27
MASDAAARGLDITGVENVVNYNMPREMNQYVHRVGRTARFGSDELEEQCRSSGKWIENS